MRSFFALIIATTLSAASTGAHATLIDFETGFDPAFTFSATFSRTGMLSSNGGNSGYNNVLTFTGSNFVGFNGGGASPLSFSLIGPGTFDLSSFVLAGAWGDQTLTFEGWANGVKSQTATLAITPSAQQFNINWLAIDKFVMIIDTAGTTNWINPACSATDCSHVALDNFNYTLNAAEAVPEPSTLAIFGLGLAGLGFMRRRRRAA